MRRKKNVTLIALQRLYITWQSFLGNGLFTYAAAGAYSFLLSALPMILMVLLILIRVLHTSPRAIQDLILEIGLNFESLDMTRFLNSITSIKTIGLFEIIIGITIFWMARRFFASIQHGMRMIYRKQGIKKALKENLIVIAGEVVLVILVVLMSIFLIAGNAFFHTVLSKNLLSPYGYKLFRNLFRFVPFAIIFVFVFLVYVFTPRTRPKNKHSLQASAACTISFFIVQIAFASFINMTKYNLVYGILSNVIVILLEVYVFFFLLLFFAQFQYVVQFFETYLLARLYLLPAYDDPGIRRQIERIMFIKPPVFFPQYALKKTKGDVIFTIDDDTTDLYYVINGIVRMTLPNQVIEAAHGRLFGEFRA